MFSKPLVAASFKPLVLALLSKGETYGYEIIQQIQDMSDNRIILKANRLYPLLHELESQGHVSIRWERNGPGPGRKYYRLTSKGMQAMTQARQEWFDVHTMLNNLWGPHPSLSTT